MKTFFGAIFLAVGIAGAISGCKKPEKYLRVDPTSIEIASDVTDAAIMVEASASWMVEQPGTGIDWVEYTYDQTGGSALWVLVTDANESLEPRKIDITIVSGDGLSVVVPFTQLAADVWFDVTPTALETLDAQGLVNRTLDVDTNIEDWYWSTGTDWLVVTRGEGDAANTLTVEAKPSRDMEPRRDTIVVRPSSDAFLALADSIPVVQAGVELLAVSEGDMNPETLDIEFSANMTEVTLTVYAKAAWTVSSAQSFVTIAPEGGQGGSISEGTPVTVTVPENNSEEEVVFTLEFVCAGQTYEYRFVQAGVATATAVAHVAPQPRTKL